MEDDTRWKKTLPSTPFGVLVGIVVFVRQPDPMREFSDIITANPSVRNLSTVH